MLMVTNAVTILIPCYNHGAHLSEAIASALGQDVPGLEVVVADDGSTDASRSVAAAFGSSVRLLPLPHRGLVPTLNAAVKTVDTRYLVRLDADDVLPSGYVSALLNGLHDAQDARVAYAYCDAELFGARRGIQRGRGFSPTVLLVHNFIHCAALVDWSRVRHIGYLDERMTDGLEDWDYWLRLLENGFRGTYVRGPRLRYRQHDAGSRNALAEARHRRMWDQIHANHPALFQTTHGRITVVTWKAYARLNRLGRKRSVS